jgi:hypothetical protein
MTAFFKPEDFGDHPTHGEWCARKANAKRDAELERLRAEVESLKEPAAFGWQCYQDRCENAYIEASVVKRVESDNARLREALEFYANANWSMDISQESAQAYSNRAYNDRGHRARAALEGKDA